MIVMRIEPISGYSSIYSIWYAAAGSRSHVTAISNNPVDPVKRIDADASGNPSVEMISDGRNATGIKPSGGILTGADKAWAQFNEENDFSADMLDESELSDMMSDMMAGSRWAVELYPQSDIPAVSDVL